jgi:ABC-type amino acid transport substrate-binding protein
MPTPWLRLTVAGLAMLPALLAHSPAALAAELVVTYPADATADDTGSNDLLEILRLALEKTAPDFGTFLLRPAKQRMAEARYLRELQNGGAINIAWSATSAEKEAALLPLRIPLRKGVLGYRVALISKENQAKISQVKSLADLKQLTIGQAADSVDVKLYQANGFTVVTAKYDDLLKMTNAGKIDLFPRSIREGFAEQERHAKENPNLAVEKSLLIYYPWPYYFFFNKADTALHKRIDVGIRRMMRDGSFEAIFTKYNGKAIALANFNGRTIYRLKNDQLPKETPYADSTLWFNPGGQ